MKTILVVEDRQDDLFQIKMACKRSGIPHDFQFATDGEEAVNYLLGMGNYADRNIYSFPSIVFLDITLPKRNGHEVLEWIRDEAGLKTLPVVMLTASLREADVNRAYELGVTSYMHKLDNPAEFGQAVRVILKYWLELNVTQQ